MSLRPWNQLPSNVVEAATINSFKNRYDAVKGGGGGHYKTDASIPNALHVGLQAKHYHSRPTSRLKIAARKLNVKLTQTQSAITVSINNVASCIDAIFCRRPAVESKLDAIGPARQRVGDAASRLNKMLIVAIDRFDATDRSVDWDTAVGL